MMPPFERIGAIVLAGGRSARFGRDKLAEPIDGRPMLEHAIDAVRAVASDLVVVVAPGDERPIPEGVRRIDDETPFQGPLAGLATGLAAMPPEVERVIVVGGDMPTLVPAVLERLLDALLGHETSILADPDEPDVRPLPLAVRRRAAQVAAVRLLAGGERRLRALLTELDPCVVPASAWQADDPRGETLRDVDTKGDLPNGLGR
jgi:molybdopterin-guanine dinucleotide biosynthesis protein A